MTRLRVSRRRLLQLGAVLPVGVLIAACGDDAQLGGVLDAGEAPTTTQAPTGEQPAPATPTATPEPLIVPEGEESRVLMPGTPYETPFHIFGTGRPGPIIAVLGGVHGNEPGGWMAAERIRDSVRPEHGALLLLPHANTQAIARFERTTDELGDLNRLYPGDPGGLPMARMAHEIVQVLQAFRPALLIDMHESWGFFSDRAEGRSGPAFLGQSLTSRGDEGPRIADTIAMTINGQILWPHEELFARGWPQFGPAPGAPPSGGSSAGPPPGAGNMGGGRSSLGLPNHVPGLSVILAEMGQQQDLERRIQLHVDVVVEAMSLLGAG